MWVNPITVPAPVILTMGSVDVDLTAAVSGVIFLGMLVFINAMLIQPYLKIVDQRENMTSGSSSSADEALARAAALESEYARKLETAQAESAALREKLRAEGKSAEESAIAAARAEAASLAAAAQARLAAQAKAAESQLEAQARMLASNIVTRTATEA